MPAGRRVAVVGAGIVGAACALSLRMVGHDVILIDPAPPGQGASKGNAGGLSAGSIVPLSAPGILRQVPKWLLDPLGPLTLRWQYLPWILPWLVRFVRAGQAERVSAQARALRDLLGPVMSAYAPLVKAAGAEHLIRHLGHLTVYRSEESFAKDARAWALRRSFGVALEELDGDELRQLEPALSRACKRGVYITENGHCTDPQALVELFVGAILRSGGRVVRERAIDFLYEGDRPVGVKTEQASHRADHVVIAAGAWSRPFAARLGDRVPLETERGYHVMVADPEVGLRRPVLDGDAKFAVTSMEGGLRIAGTVELAGLDAPPDWRRAQVLLRLGRELLPGLPAEVPEKRLSMWMGHRPSLPDSLPVIGPAPRAPNVLYAFGHGHTGLTAAAMTGRIITDLISGRTPPIDIGPFRADRF